MASIWRYRGPHLEEPLEMLLVLTSHEMIKTSGGGTNPENWNHA
jgi:hypothetical protein